MEISYFQPPFTALVFSRWRCRTPGAAQIYHSSSGHRDPSPCCSWWRAGLTTASSCCSRELSRWDIYKLTTYASVNRENCVWEFSCNGNCKRPEIGLESYLWRNSHRCKLLTHKVLKCPRSETRKQASNAILSPNHNQHETYANNNLIIKFILCSILFPMNFNFDCKTRLHWDCKTAAGISVKSNNQIKEISF